MNGGTGILYVTVLYTGSICCNSVLCSVTSVEEHNLQITFAKNYFLAHCLHYVGMTA